MLPLGSQITKNTSSSNPTAQQNPQRGGDASTLKQVVQKTVLTAEQLQALHTRALNSGSTTQIHLPAQHSQTPKSALEQLNEKLWALPKQNSFEKVCDALDALSAKMRSTSNELTEKEQKAIYFEMSQLSKDPIVTVASGQKAFDSKTDVKNYNTKLNAVKRATSLLYPNSKLPGEEIGKTKQTNKEIKQGALSSQSALERASSTLLALSQKGASDQDTLIALKKIISTMNSTKLFSGEEKKTIYSKTSQLCGSSASNLKYGKMSFESDNTNLRHRLAAVRLAASHLYPSPQFPKEEKQNEPFIIQPVATPLPVLNRSTIEQARDTLKQIKHAPVDAIQKAFEETTAKLSEAEKEAIYGAMWKLSDKTSSDLHFGENAFKSDKTDISTKIKAVKLAASLLHPNGSPSSSSSESSEEEVQPTINIQPIAAPLDLTQSTIVRSKTTLEAIIDIAFSNDENLNEDKRKAKIGELVDQLDSNVQGAVYGKIYEFSEDPNKGGDGWGQKHRLDDFLVLINALTDVLGKEGQPILDTSINIQPPIRLHPGSVSSESSEEDSQEELPTINTQPVAAGHIKLNQSAIESLSEEAKQAIYLAMWELSGKPEISNFGENAFKSAETDIFIKVQAINLADSRVHLVSESSEEGSDSQEEQSAAINISTIERARDFLENATKKGDTEEIAGILKEISYGIGLELPDNPFSEEEKEAIFLATWELSGKPDKPNFGETAFKSAETDDSIKVEAINLAASLLHPVSEQPPVLDLTQSTVVRSKSTLESMTEIAYDDQLDENTRKSKIKDLVNNLHSDVKNAIYGSIYELSEDPNKGGDGWGEEHMTDDLIVLINALADILNNQNQ
jgi:hypothetical protein